MISNRYLSILKRGSAQKADANFQKQHQVVLTKLTKGASVSFASDSEGCFQRIAGDGADDSVGRAHSPFWPWVPCMTGADVRRLRTNLAVMIATLADLERWPDDLRSEVLERAARDPLSALMPNLAHFRDRLTEAQAEAQAHEEAARRAWRFNRES